LVTYTRQEGAYFAAIYAERIIALRTFSGIIQEADEHITGGKIPSFEEALDELDFLGELGGGEKTD